MISILYAILFSLAIYSEFHVIGMANNAKYALIEKNIIDSSFAKDNSQLISNLNTNYFLTSDISFSDRNIRSSVNSIKEKLEARSKFFKGQVKSSFVKNDNTKSFSQDVVNQDQKPNSRGYPFKETAMKIECLFSLKNCMYTLTDDNEKKFNLHRIPIDGRNHAFNYFSNYPYFTTWKVKKEPYNTWMKKIYKKIYFEKHFA